MYITHLQDKLVKDGGVLVGFTMSIIVRTLLVRWSILYTC